MATPPPPPPPPQLPSLRQQQQRYVMAQHLMATQTVPPLQWRNSGHARPSNGGSANAPTNGTNFTSTGGRPEEMDVKRKRRRRGKNGQQSTTMKSPTPSDVRGAEPALPPRKPAYVLQKEHRDELAEQVRVLEERVEQLRLQAGLPTRKDKQSITEAQTRNAELEDKIHINTRYVGKLQSLVMRELQMPPVNTLSTFIHLPCDMAQRRAILRGMKDVKLRRAAETGIERFRFLEATNKSYLSEERFTTPEDGVYHCNRWELNEFAQFTTARQLYDALLFWIYNMEISVTEMIGQLTLREDCEDIEPTIWNHRIISTTEDVGCTEELNLVGFAQFYESYEPLGGAPLGVITYDTVNVDDLYPYQPHSRTRKDVQAYHLFCEVVDPHTHHKAIVLKTCLLNAQLPPEFPVEPHVVGKLHEYMSRWIELMNQYLNEYTFPPPQP